MDHKMDHYDDDLMDGKKHKLRRNKLVGGASEKYQFVNWDEKKNPN